MNVALLQRMNMVYLRVRASARSWRNAIQGIGYNPVALYWLQEQPSRNPKWRRKASVMVFLSIAILGAAYMTTVSLVPDARGILEYALGVDAVQLPMRYMLLAANIAYGSWLLWSLAAFVTATTSVLSCTSTGGSLLRISEITSRLRLSEEDIVVGIVYRTAKKMMPLVLTGAILFTVVLAANSGHLYKLSSQSVRESMLLGSATETAVQILVLAPITVAALAISGLLGVVVIALLLVSQGRGLKPHIGKLNALFVIFMYAIYLYLVSGASGGESGSEFFTGGARYWFSAVFVRYPWMDLVGFPSIVITLVTVGLVAGRSIAAIRGAFIPLTVWLGLTILVLSEGLLKLGLDPSQILNLMYAFGALTVFNPWAVPHPACYGFDYAGLQAMHWTEWLRWPVLITTQLVLIAVTATFARSAVARWRQECA